MGIGPSVGKKLSLFVGLVVTLTAGATSYVAYQTIETRFAEMLRKDTLDTATLLSSRVRNELRHVAERTRVLADAALQEFKNSDDQIRFLEDNLAVDDQLIAMTMYRRSGAGRDAWAPVFRLTRPEGDPAHLEDPDFDELDLRYPLDIGLVSEGAVEVAVGQLRDHTPILRLALPLVRGKKGRFTQLLAVEVKQERITAAFAEATSHFSFLIDRRGRVLTQTDPTHFTFGEDLSALPILQMARSTEAPNGNLDYYELPGSSLQYGGFHKVGYADLTVVTQVPRSLIAHVLQKFTRQSLLLAGACALLAMAFGLVAAWGIVGHRLARLGNAIRRLGDGKYAVHFPEQGSEDELGEFARKLQSVCDELRDREKVHGTYTKLKARRFKSKLGDGTLALKGERLKAFALHCHLHGLDEVVARAEPELLIESLNDFNQRLAKLVEGEHGIVDRLSGGSMTALWGIPSAHKQDADRILGVALEIRRIASELSESFKARHLPQVRVAVGLHYGPVIAGQVGAEDRREYTALGEAVEVATRIQSFTEQFGTDILLTGAAATQAPPWFTLENVAPADDQNPELFELIGKAKQAGKTPASAVQPAPEAPSSVNEGDGDGDGGDSSTEAA